MDDSLKEEGSKTVLPEEFLKERAIRAEKFLNKRRIMKDLERIGTQVEKISKAQENIPQILSQATGLHDPSKLGRLRWFCLKFLIPGIFLVNIGFDTVRSTSLFVINRVKPK